MKRISIIILCIVLVLALCACSTHDDDGLVLNGMVYCVSRPIYEDYDIVYLECENENYAVVVPDSVELKWDSTKVRMEFNASISDNIEFYLDWGTELIVVCGEETEAIADEPFRGPIEVAKWYIAEAVSTASGLSNPDIFLPISGSAAAKDSQMNFGRISHRSPHFTPGL